MIFRCSFVSVKLWKLLQLHVGGGRNFQRRSAQILGMWNQKDFALGDTSYPSYRLLMRDYGILTFINMKPLDSSEDTTGQIPVVHSAKKGYFWLEVGTSAAVFVVTKDLETSSAVFAATKTGILGQNMVLSLIQYFLCLNLTTACAHLQGRNLYPNLSVLFFFFFSETHFADLYSGDWVGRRQHIWSFGGNISLLVQRRQSVFLIMETERIKQQSANLNPYSATMEKTSKQLT